MFEPALLKNINIPNLFKLTTYLDNGGYQALKKALTLNPDTIIQMVKDSGLRGRGGAGFPTGLKWSFIPKDPTIPKYLCCNADEGEPGTFKDRVIIEKDPHQLLEGMAIASYAIGASIAYIYIRGEFAFGAQRLEEAISEAISKGYLGKNILDSNCNIDIYVHRGAGAYICGEETALLESIEGRRALPRMKPPFPAQVGLFGKPTVINNVETLACVPHIINRGASWFASIGPAKSPGPKLFPVSGHVNRPGLYELPMGTPLQEIIYDHAGGIKGGGRLKAVIPGGVSAPMLTERDINTPMDFDSLAAKGSMLGSGAVVVIDDRTCIVKAALITHEFFHHESCGKCTPCREGLDWIVKIMRKVEHGEGREGDIDILLKLCGDIFGRTFCPLGDGAVMALRAAINNFGEEFEYHLKNKKCMVNGDF